MLGIFGPAEIGQEVARERTLGETLQTPRGTRTGTGLLASIYNTFGETGLMVFLIVCGLALIAGCVWFTWSRWGMEADDD